MSSVSPWLWHFSQLFTQLNPELEKHIVMSKEDSQRRACFRDEMVGRLAARNLPEKWIFRGTQEGASVGPSVSRALAACALTRCGDM